MLDTSHKEEMECFKTVQAPLYSVSKLNINTELSLGNITLENQKPKNCHMILNFSVKCILKLARMRTAANVPMEYKTLPPS